MIRINDEESIKKKTESYINGSLKGKHSERDPERISKDVLLGLKGTTYKNTDGTPAPSIYHVARVFGDVLYDSIQSNGSVPEGVKAVLNYVEDNDDAQVTPSGKAISITVSIKSNVTKGDLSRKSFSPDASGQLNDLAALYNNGVDHIMKPVIGDWTPELTGKTVRVVSRTEIKASHFLQDAIDDFMNNYGKTYNVISINPREEWNITNT